MCQKKCQENLILSNMRKAFQVSNKPKMTKYMEKGKIILKRFKKKVQGKNSKAPTVPTKPIYPSYEEVFPSDEESTDVSKNDSGIILNKSSSEPSSLKKSNRGLKSITKFLHSTKTSCEGTEQSTTLTQLEDSERFKGTSKELNILDTTNEFLKDEILNVENPLQKKLGLSNRDCTIYTSLEFITPKVEVVVAEVHAESSSKAVNDTTEISTKEINPEPSSKAASDNTDVSAKEINDKFVVNLYESRRSNRWKEKKAIEVNNFDTIQIADDTRNIQDDKDDSIEDASQLLVDYDADQTVVYSKVVSQSDAMFYKLKKLRDIECVKMHQTSNALKTLRQQSEQQWAEELLIERMLLESNSKYNLLSNKIRDLNYSDTTTERSKHRGNILLTNFQFQLKPQTKPKYTEFYVLALSYDTTVLMTKIVPPTNEKLIFNEAFSLQNVDDNFAIKVEVFSMRVDTSSDKFLFLKKKTKNLCPMFKIYYENVHTSEAQESTILKTSFNLCGQMTITKADLGNATFSLSHIPEDSSLSAYVTATVTVQDVVLNTNLSGFLTLGTPDANNNVTYWERKWCSLKGNKFLIYNYPQDEEFEKPPVDSLDLEYCFAPLVKQSRNCPRRKSFLLKTGRPSTLSDNNNVMLRKKNNFVLEKHYMCADSQEDLEKWTSELESALEALLKWKRLVFADDYYLSS